MAFSFENHERNANLISMGLIEPKARKTGTTICAMHYKDGVILGADTRSTSGNTVADKNCDKIHYLADSMYCGGAGTAADTDKVTKMVASQLELHRLLINKPQVPVIAATRMIRQHLYQYQGHIGAALIIGGVDATGAHVYSIAPHGSIDKLEYTAMGSGCLAAIAVLESGFKPDMEVSRCVHCDLLATNCVHSISRSSIANFAPSISLHSSALSLAGGGQTAGS